MRCIVLVVSLVFSAVLFSGENEVALLKKLPDSLEGLIKGEVRAFGDRKFGAALGYKNNTEQTLEQLTVYMYDGGYGPIADGLESATTTQVFTAAVSDIFYYESEGVYRHVKQHSEDTVKLAGGWKAKLTHLEYEIDISGQGEFIKVHSYLLLTAARGYLLKIRLTCDNGQNTEKIVSAANSVLMSVSGV